MANGDRGKAREVIDAKKAQLDEILGERVSEISAAQFRELLSIIAPLILLVAAALWLASRFIEPAPPKHVVIATGSQAGAYYTYGQRYAAILKRHGITLEVRATPGSMANVGLLTEADPAKRAHIALLQGGITNSHSTPGIVSLGRVFIEPLWVFYRGEASVDRLHQLSGLRIAVGPEGSGTRQLALALLAANGITPDTARLVPIADSEAARALKAGEVDAIFLAAAIETPLIQALLTDGAVKLMSFAQGEAYARRFSYLHRIVLPQGAIDLMRNTPVADVTLVAPVAAVVARDDLHPAIQGLLVEALKEVHGDSGMFHRLGEFPSVLDPEFGVTDEVERAYKAGPNWLKRTLPFWLASLIERMIVVAVPVVGALVPLFKLGPALYKWRVRRRLLYWYGRLKALESVVSEDPNGESLAEEARELGLIESAVSNIPIPLGFADQYYSLRAAIDLVRQRLESLGSASGPANG